MDPNNAIKIMREYVEADKKMRDNSIESDYDRFCEGKNLVIEELIRLAEIGKATKKAFDDCMYIEALGFRMTNINELLEWAEDN